MNNLKLALKVANLNVFYGEKPILRNIYLDCYENKITTILGCVNSGKSTLLKSLNRLIESENNVRYEGKIEFFGQSIFSPRTNLNRLRRQIGMISATPNTFSMSIYDNVACKVKLTGYYSKNELNTVVEIALRRAGLWDEVKYKLHQPATDLSLIQQHLLSISRALALQPKILIMDEPCMELGIVRGMRIEEVLQSLRQNLTIIVATKNPQFAFSISDYIGLLTVNNHIGELVDFYQTSQFVKNCLVPYPDYNLNYKNPV
ncbi:MAG: ATP-binding cassette domain-containing protein [Nostocales cyanobacterium 94392]|nr:ATP-binding cassette domain-containing protein [Nostocales cyanobacterium 94392]